MDDRTSRIRITVDGKPALTLAQAADRYGLAASSMRAAIHRLGDAITPADHLDGKPLYLIAALDRVMGQRPGRGAPGQPRTRRDNEQN